MSLYKVSTDQLEEVAQTTFAAEGLFERRDLQRLLRRNIAPISEDLLVIAEEYGQWEDSNRRIDLLCLGRDRELVVVEIKRTEDGGHMELQAVRYAAMVSSMTLEQTIQAYSQGHNCDLETAQSEVLEFLALDSLNEVRIILVSADFSTELTTSVLWLNRHGLDITCIRLRPYRMNNEVLIDATQIIPLPEAAEYEVKLRQQEQEKRKVLSDRQETFRKFWGQLIERSRARTDLLTNKSTSSDHWLSTGLGRSGFFLSLSLTQAEHQVECFIRLSGGAKPSKAAFRALQFQREKIESDFGGQLDWNELPNRLGCRIYIRPPGGWKTPEAQWPALQDEMIDAMVRLERALRQPIAELDLHSHS